MSAYEVDGLLRGAAPILFNRYTEKARPGKLRHEELLEEATRRVYRHPETQSIILPPWNLKRCLLDGARMGDVKQGKRSIVPYLQALMIVQDYPDFGRADYDGLHVHPGRIPPRTGPMVTIYRPKFDAGWTLSFRLLVGDSSIPPETLRQIVTFAGMYSGLGAWRPEHGRFVLDRFDIRSLDGGAIASATVPKKSKRIA